MRNANFHNIYDNSVFERLPNPFLDVANKLHSEANLYNLGSGPMKLPDLTEQNITIREHDVIFWLGDLNYRIDLQIPTEVVFAKCSEGAWTTLHVVDQLNEERSRGAVFSGFEEGELAFPPTYKYEPGSDRYENREGKKLRAPAWCDRVLWRPNRNIPDSVSLLAYAHFPALKHSDHRPVFAKFSVKAHRAIVEKERATYSDLMKFLDKWENATAPRIDVPAKSINFGIVKYMETTNRKLLIRNAGGSCVRWVLVTKHEEANICKPYIQITPTSGILMPGEESYINFSVMIQESNIGLLENSMIDDVVILRVINGPDSFLVASGELNTASVREYEKVARKVSFRDSNPDADLEFRDAADLVLEPDMADIYGARAADDDAVTTFKNENKRQNI